MSHPPSDAPQQSQLRKRRSDADEGPRVRAASSSSYSHQSQATHATPTPPPTRTTLELRAFGLEDRADAVISSNASGWSLNQLPQWRQEMAQHARSQATSNATSKAYIAQRQRDYKQQMLRAARPPPTQ